MPEDEYQVGLAACKHNLHGRIIWPKGSTPLKVSDLKARLAPLWKTLGKWGLTSLGKGFYEFSFSSLEDVQSVRSVGSWKLTPGVLKLFAWTSDFNPNFQQNTTAQVWLRIYGLAQEYWRPKILFAIASSVGTPIRTDQLTSKPRFDREFGHFARVLVDVDLQKEAVNRVLVERTGFAFFVDMEFENWPSFCHYCNIIGHDQAHCKRFSPDKNKNGEEHAIKPQTQTQKKVYVAKNQGKESNNETVVEVCALDKPAMQRNSDFDPLLESILKNKDDINVVEPLAEINTPVVGQQSVVQQPAVQQPAEQHPVVEQIDDESSSTASEFVDATQSAHEEIDENTHFVTNKSPSNLQSSPASEHTPSPDRVAKDMQFLHTSWANLAEQEENEDGLGFNVNNKNSLNLPWFCIGDFNTTLGAHEVRSHHTPAKLPMEEFATWSDNNNLFHLPTKGSQFTWINGRQGRNCTEKRLDRVICNQEMFNKCDNFSCSTLTKHRSDHFPLLLDIHFNFVSSDGYSESRMKQEMLAKETLENALNIEEIFWKEKSRVNWHCQGDRNTAFFHRITKIKQAYKNLNSLGIDNNIVTDPELISNHVVNHFSTLFSASNSILDNGLVEEVIPKLVNDNTNNILTMLPSAMEIKNAVFSMNKDGAPGPDGFGAFFFQTYWDIIKTDVIEAVLEFFQFNWIMPNFNANTVVLIPKESNADTIAQFRPIALANLSSKLSQRWQLGNGSKINFWNHDWCGSALSSLFNFPHHVQSNLHSKVSDYIANQQWHIPWQLQQSFPSLMSHVTKVTIPIEEKQDQLIWKHSKSGVLSLKDAYHFTSPARPKLDWTRFIWNAAIPPSKSFMTWRLFHNRLSTDENLASRGFLLPSMCSLCCMQPETSLHLFLHCPFATSIWNWFSSVLNLNINLSTIVDVMKLANRGWSSQCQIVISAAIVSIFNNIWLCRNSARFKNIKPNLTSVISLITSTASIAGNVTSQTSTSSMTDFVILKFFNVNLHPPKAPNIVEIIWNPPLVGWVKCNTDDSSFGNPGLAPCAGIFRNHNGASLGCFAYNIGIAMAFFAEVLGIIMAIECAFERGWKHLWIESDSRIAILAFKNSKIIPWQLHNRWSNSLAKLIDMEILVTHVYRDGNTVVDKLTKLGLIVNDFVWWDSTPSSIRADVAKNRDGIPFYRFC
ncbi:hypothetical protein TSUD_95050 [Trifolium subterraneum]|uniref:RNase H type-1 domain-containing protein n=1 Tax=Trifolium subterraneum TaxID=3900 RepID=A0A2Z6M4V3_TRISU|nr:hypothetical protein TSUD_95050 [Trifolium subterraneum]